MVTNVEAEPHGSGTKLSDPAVLAGCLWWLEAGLHAAVDKWPHSRLGDHLKICHGEGINKSQPLTIDGKYVPTYTNTHLSSRALSKVRQATKVLSMNMWHMMTWGHCSIKVSVADGSKVPLREMRQRRCRRVQQDKASKNDAFAFR